jgi:hypothetical protein
VLVDTYFIMAVQMGRPIIQYLRVNQYKDAVLSKTPKEIDLHVSSEWSFQNILHVNAKDRA